MALTKKKPKVSAARLFSIPSRRFGLKIAVHSDEKGCHADCRACGWRNKRGHSRLERDKAAWGHEKSCKVSLPKPKRRGLRKKRQTVSGSLSNADVFPQPPTRTKAESHNVFTSKSKNLKRHLNAAQVADVDKHLETITKGMRRGK